MNTAILKNVFMVFVAEFPRASKLSSAGRVSNLRLPFFLIRLFFSSQEKPHSTTHRFYNNLKTGAIRYVFPLPTLLIPVSAKQTPCPYIVE